MLINSLIGSRFLDGRTAAGGVIDVCHGVTSIWPMPAPTGRKVHFLTDTDILAKLNLWFTRRYDDEPAVTERPSGPPSSHNGHGLNDAEGRGDAVARNRERHRRRVS
jgi:hypothetical protein